MKTKQFVFLLLLSFGMGIRCNLQAQTIYVDISNNTGIEDGTESHPFNTIKEGINAASTGNQVLIKQGTYVPDDSWSGNPHTLFLKAGVSLIGAGSDKTLIDGIVVDQQASNLSIGLENLKFDEFHFTRGTQAGPFNENNIIRDCAATLISLPFGAGIPVNDTTPGPNYGFLIENNDLGTAGIIEFKQGAGASELKVMGNTCGYIQVKSGGGYTYLLDNNDIQYGIFDASGTNYTTISNNIIHNGTIVDRSGGNQYGAEDQIIENNIITADENSPAFIDEIRKAGISTSARSGTIRNNTITCTGRVHGIYTNSGPPLNIINNTITLDEVQVPSIDPLEEGRIGIFSASGWGFATGNKIHGGEIGYYSKAGTVEFSNNTIERSNTGFFGSGAEDVHHNIIKDCYGDGVILDGQKGPLSYNIIINNAGAGIRILKTPIDLGGGDDNSPGKNTIKGNGNFDLYIETTNTLHPTLYARHNFWDHENANEISQLDIRDGSDSTGLVNVDFTPFGGLGINDKVKVFELCVVPNPTSGLFSLQFSPFPVPGESFQVDLVDLSGEVLNKLIGTTSPEGLNFDVSCLPAGIYLLRIHNNNKLAFARIIKQ